VRCCHTSPDKDGAVGRALLITHAKNGGGIQQHIDFSSIFQTAHSEKTPAKNPQLTYSRKSLSILLTSDLINSAGLCHPNMKNDGFSMLESEK